jgi:cytochrome P450
MHYTNAVTLESFRIVSFAPFSVPHCATADIPVGNFIIPKGAGIFPGLLNAMYDPNHFPDPHSFKPERFLDGDGKYKPHDHVIPFSIGKRYCPGQSLAEREFFLFLVGILQKFDITSPPMQKLPSYHIDDIPVPGIVRPCPNYEMIFSLRE